MVQWPEWTMITTQWDCVTLPDPDEYTALCLRCQETGKEPYTLDGTQVECQEFLQGHWDDPDPNPPKPPPPPRPRPRGTNE